MKIIILAVLILCCISPFSQLYGEPASEPRTVLETFEKTRGAVVVKEFVEVGKVGKPSEHLKTDKNMIMSGTVFNGFIVSTVKYSLPESNVHAKGLQFLTANDGVNRIALIDEVEVPSIIKALEYELKELSSSKSVVGHRNIDYVTKSGARFTVSLPENEFVFRVFNETAEIKDAVQEVTQFLLVMRKASEQLEKL